MQVVLAQILLVLNLDFLLFLIIRIVCLVIVVVFLRCIDFLGLHHILFLLLLLHMIVFLCLFLGYKILLLYLRNLRNIFLNLICIVLFRWMLGILKCLRSCFCFFWLLCKILRFSRKSGVSTVSILSFSEEFALLITIPLVFIIPIYITAYFWVICLCFYAVTYF